MGGLTGWKGETTLAELAPDERIEIRPAGASPIWTTPREPMRKGRMAGTSDRRPGRVCIFTVTGSLSESYCAI